MPRFYSNEEVDLGIQKQVDFVLIPCNILEQNYFCFECQAFKREQEE